VTLENFDIDGGGMFDPETGFWVPNSSTTSPEVVVQVAAFLYETKIKNNHIRGAEGIGLEMIFTALSEVSGNALYWNSQNGFALYESFGNTISNNKIFENGAAQWQDGGTAGVRVYNSSSTILASNEIFNNVNHGIFLEDAFLTTIDGNTVYNNGALGYFYTGYNQPSGIQLYSSNTGTIIQNNIISNNVRYGIRFGYSSNSTTLVQNNTIGETTALLSVKPLDADAIAVMAKKHQAIGGLQVNLKKEGLEEGVGTPRKRARKADGKQGAGVSGRKLQSPEALAKKYGKLAKQRFEEAKSQKAQIMKKFWADRKAEKLAAVNAKKAADVS
jgi:parallel beta-helix repeat protein